ncbi:hypothetical protein J3B02_004998, partial [Coemansia erecta]
MGKKGRNSGKRRNAQQSTARDQQVRQQRQFGGRSTDNSPDTSLTSNQQVSQPTAGPNISRKYSYADYLVTADNSDNRPNEQLPLRGASEGYNQLPHRQVSISSSRHSHSGDNSAMREHDSLASVISHYIHGIDSDNITDMLASRYYGNMTHITESGTVDRSPKPMNSTLPLFSPSVALGRRMVRARSTNASEELMQKRPSFAAAATNVADNNEFAAGTSSNTGSGSVGNMS